MLNAFHCQSLQLSDATVALASGGVGDVGGGVEKGVILLPLLTFTFGRQIQSTAINCRQDSVHLTRFSPGVSKGRDIAEIAGSVQSNK